MIKRGPTASIIALLVITTALATPGLVGADGTAREEIDADHSLTTSSAHRTYEEEGAVSTDLTVPNSVLTISKDLDGCGLDDGTVSAKVAGAKSDFVCFTNREDIAYSIRVFIPAEYWTPYIRESKRSVGGKTNATFEPVKSGTYQSIEFDAPAGETVAFEIPETTQAVYYAIERPKSRIEKLTGWSIGSKEEPWTRIEPASLSGDNATVRIRTSGNPEDAMVQYDTSGSGEDPSWLNVPTKPGKAPVYRFTKSGVNNTVYVVSTTSDPPAVRYKTNSSAASGIGSAIEDIKNMKPRIEDLGIDLPDISLPDITLPWGGGG